MTSINATNDVAMLTTMTMILGVLLLFIVALRKVTPPVKLKPRKSDGIAHLAFLKLPPPNTAAYCYEMYCVYYSIVWMFAFGIIVVFQLYESFTANTYMVVLVTLSLGYLLQPVLFPQTFHNSPDRKLRLLDRHSTKANVFIAVYSFIGNYWFTHYFYNVLKAQYTFPSHRLNSVPLCLYFATHFYFSSYHTLSNCVLRYIEWAFERSVARTFLFWVVVFSLSYFTAFMETLTISR